MLPISSCSGACSCLIACQYLRLDDVFCRSGAKLCYAFMGLILRLCHDSGVEMCACNLFRFVRLRCVEELTWTGLACAGSDLHGVMRSALFCSNGADVR